MALIEQLREMEAYYGVRASYHDRGYSKPNYLEAWSRHAQCFQELLAGRNVLEVACGTGHWTAVLADVANSVVAVDLSDEMLAYAGKKAYVKGNVRIQCADAYLLTDVRGSFDAGFAFDWWSHIPKSKIAPFLTTFHGKLQSGSVVVFSDWLHDTGWDELFLRNDDEGNVVQLRRVPDGRQFEVIKNFPSETDLRSTVAPFAAKVEYTTIKTGDGGSRWVLAYTLK